MKKFFNVYNIFLTVIGLLVFGAILAPILLELGLETPAKYLYFLYSLFCHQIDYRSLHLFDHQHAWCTRDTFIWSAIFISGLLVKFVKVRSFKWYEVVLFIIPIALDGGIQLIATLIGLQGNGEIFYASTNFSRMVTGSLFGLGIGLWIFPVLRTYTLENKLKYTLSPWKASLGIFAGLFIVYLGFIGLWGLTSDEYKPNNIIDSKSRFPEDKSEWLYRRKHATCPVDVEKQGFVNFNCE